MKRGGGREKQGAMRSASSEQSDYVFLGQPWVQIPPLRPEKSTSEEMLFSMKRTLRCMKNEAGLRPMKRGFAARRGAGASLHASAASASREPQVSASRLPTANASLQIMLLSRVKSLRRWVDFISLSAEQKISQPRSGYFTFCTCKIFHLSLNVELIRLFFLLLESVSET